MEKTEAGFSELWRTWTIFDAPEKNKKKREKTEAQINKSDSNKLNYRETAEKSVRFWKATLALPLCFKQNENFPFRSVFILPCNLI